MPCKAPGTNLKSGKTLTGSAIIRACNTSLVAAAERARLRPAAKQSQNLQPNSFSQTAFTGPRLLRSRTQPSHARQLLQGG